MFWLKQSTVVTVPFGPFVDKTDGVALEVGLATAMDNATTGIRVSKNGAAMIDRNSATAPAYDAMGVYRIALSATDTNTLGTLRIIFEEAATCLPVWADYMVIPANVWDSLFGADALDVNVIQWLGTAAATPTVAGVPEVDVTHLGGGTQSAIDLKDFADAGYNPANNRIIGIEGTKNTFDDLNDIPTGSTMALTAGAVDQIWDEPMVGHAGADSAGQVMNDWQDAGRLDAILDARMAEASISTTGGAVDTVTTLTGHTAQTGDTFALANGAAGFVAIDTVVDAIKVKTDFLPNATAGAAGGVFIAGTNAATTITTSLTTTFTGNLTGSVGSLTGHTNQTADHTAAIAALPTTAEVNAEVDTALSDIGLDHLVSAAVIGTDVTDNSIIAKMVSSAATADWDGFVNTTDSLQAVRDHIGDGTNLTEAGGTGDHLTAIDLPNQTMDITGNLSGSVGSVTGAVGSVTGAVGSVTAAITLPTIPANWITAAGVADGTIDAATFAAGAINADAIATDAINSLKIAANAIGSSELAANCITSAELSTTAATKIRDTIISDATTFAGATIAAIETDTQDIQARLPAALVAGRIDADASAIATDVTAATNLAASALGIVSGACEGTPSTTVIQTDLAEATDDHFIGRVVVFTSGAAAGQATDITDYTGSTGTITVTALTTAPSAADTFTIV